MSTVRQVILTVYPARVIHRASCVQACCQQAFTSLEKRWGRAPCLTWWPLTLNGLQHVSYPPRESCLPGQTNCTSRCSPGQRLGRVSFFFWVAEKTVSERHVSPLKMKKYKYFLITSCQILFFSLSLFFSWSESHFSVIIYSDSGVVVRSEQMWFWGSCSKL